MPSSILNSDDGVISGTSGIKAVGGDDGVLVFQSKGTETARINTDSQIVTVAGTASLPPIAPTGDLNTGIYFPGADRVGFATGGSQRGEFDASGNFQFNSGYGSTATAYGCRAWVNFNGTGTPAIREDGNVSSITDNGTGDYTVNFTTAMPDANYAVSGTTMRNGTSGEGSAGIYIVPFGSTTYSNAMNSGSVRIQCKLLQSFEDPLAVFVVIFR